MEILAGVERPLVLTFPFWDERTSTIVSALIFGINKTFIITSSSRPPVGTAFLYNA